jgi:hypothetical protein
MKPLNVESESRTFDHPSADLSTVVMRRVDVVALKNHIHRLEGMLVSKEKRFVAVNAKLLGMWKRAERQRVKIERLCLFLRSRGVEPDVVLGETTEEPSEPDPRTLRPEKTASA